MTELTAEKVRLVMLALRELRLRGLIGEDDSVTPAAMARVSNEIGVPLAESTFRRAESDALALARNAMRAYRETLSPSD